MAPAFRHTTDSASRALHGPNGPRAIARGERSQHRNRDIALRRRAEGVEIRAAPERGNPIRILRAA